MIMNSEPYVKFKHIQVTRYSRKDDTLSQSRFDVEPTSTTLDQH